MNSIQLGLRENRTAYAPGDLIVGAVTWTADAAPSLASARLCWFTRGKGTSDHGVVATEKFDAPQPSDMRTFQFTAPAIPHSYSGKTISIIWCVEAVFGTDEDEFERVEIVIAPGGVEKRT